VENDVRTIAFPAISCGVYGYPLKEACRIAVGTTAGFLENHPEIEMVRFVLFSGDDYAVYRDHIASR
jgi:O-acetyl-ADP-ribose deacetylase (regulator of RNase III)